MFGGTGVLGRAIVHRLEAAGWRVERLGSSLDVRDQAAVQQALRILRPELVVNCAGHTDVAWCERHRGQTFDVNAKGARHVAAAAAAVQAHHVLISTDYVFGDPCDAAAPRCHDEHMPRRALNAYGASKLLAEDLVRAADGESLVVRVASLFGGGASRHRGPDFVQRILAKASAGEPLRIVDDQWMNPTYVPDAAEAITRLAIGRTSGIVHVCSPDPCTWYDFAQEVLRASGVDAQPMRARAVDMPGVARAGDSSLSTRRLEAMGIRMRSRGDCLREWAMAATGQRA